MALILFLLFLLVPILELAVILRVGQVIGAWWTVVALVSVSVAGAALVKREGRGTWQRFRAALDAGRMPAEEVVDGVLLLVGGVLMLTPGFVTDVVGLLLAVPASRRLVNRTLRRRVRAAFGLSPPRSRRGPASADPAEVEVVRIERRDRPAADRSHRSDKHPPGGDVGGT